MALWFQMATTRQKMSSLYVVSRIFKKVSANIHDFRFRWLHLHHIQILSNCCRKKYNQSVSWIFKISFLAGFCYLAQLSCVLLPSVQWKYQCFRKKRRKKGSFCVSVSRENPAQWVENILSGIAFLLFSIWRFHDVFMIFYPFFCTIVVWIYWKLFCKNVRA